MSKSPRENVSASVGKEGMRRDKTDTDTTIYSNDPTDISQGNYGLWSFRGKRYEATTHDDTAAPTGGTASA